MTLSTNNSYKFNWNQPNQGKNGVKSTEIRKGQPDTTCHAKKATHSSYNCI